MALCCIFGGSSILLGRCGADPLYDPPISELAEHADVLSQDKAEGERIQQQGVDLIIIVYIVANSGENLQ